MTPDTTTEISFLVSESEYRELEQLAKEYESRKSTPEWKNLLSIITHAHTLTDNLIHIHGVLPTETVEKLSHQIKQKTDNTAVQTADTPASILTTYANQRQRGNC